MPVETKAKSLNNKGTTAERTTAVRNRDVGHRKTRASSCPRPTHNECKAKATERISKNAMTAKPSETSFKTATRAPTEQPKAEEKSHALYEMNSHKAFTVFAPNPKKRQDIQQKAAAELAALEDLRLRKSMSYISTSPSTVGGCLTLEEVRTKQQQEMQIRRRHKQVKKYILEPSPAVKE